MNNKVKFYKCPICGNIIGLIDGDTEHMTCCVRKLELLVANSQDASLEKHVPTYTVNENRINVTVGEAIHPMEEKHYISWVALVSKDKTTRITLHPGEAPEVSFEYIPGSTIYAYCNLHGLWEKKVD